MHETYDMFVRYRGTERIAIHANPYNHPIKDALGKRERQQTLRGGESAAAEATKYEDEDEE